MFTSINWELLKFIFMGLIGGFTFIMIKAKGWDEFKEFTTVRRVIVGGIAGFLYYFVYSEWDFPNIVMSFVSGYMGTDFIEGLINKLKPKKE